MAQNAIGNSADIFLRGGALQQGAQGRIFDAINNAANLYAQQQARKEAQLAAERMKQMEIDAQRAKIQSDLARDPEAILAQAIQNGPESLTPQQRAIFEANQRMQGAKVAIQPMTGQAYNPYQPVDLNNVRAQSSPVGAVMDMGVSQPQAGQSSPVNAMMDMGQQGVLPPPRVAGGGGTFDQFMADTKAELPAPIGEAKPKQVFKDTTGIGQTPVGKVKQFEKELDFYGQKILKDYDVQLTKEQQDKAKSVSQRAIDRMIELNEKLNEAGGLVSDKNSIVGNIRASAAGAPYAGKAVERVASPKVAAMRDEYSKLQSLLFPFYAKSSGLGATAIDSEGARKAMLDSMGDPNGVYESNKSQLESLSNMIGTGTGATKATTSQFREGQTATNPKTGERMIVRGGKWQKM
jgi:hypothetical protein